MKISVIMPARNEAKNIGRTLDALVAQSLPKSDFEVILADNGSSDDTISIAKNYSSTVTLKIVSTTAKTIAQVRNDGANVASGEILAFLDSDCTVKPGWLEQALAEKPPASIWGAHYAVPENATWVGKVWEEFQASSRSGATTFLPTSNLFVERNDFIAIGGFASSQQTSEDVDFSLRAKRYGLNVIAIPALAVVHEETPSTLAQFFRQNFWHGRHVVRMFLRNLPSTKSLPLVALSVYFLLMLIATTASLVAAVIMHHVLLLLILVVLLVLPAAALSIRTTAPTHRLVVAPALAFLYLTYLTARGLAIVLPAVRKHR
jgi:glycosyltransferase involved in cell wall biosynthesis